MRSRTVWAGVGLVLALALGAGLGWRGWQRAATHREVLGSLERGDLAAARAALERPHDWGALLSRIAARRDPSVVQGAFDILFADWYAEHEDTHYGYREDLRTTRALVALGAKPGFRHLVQATGQNKMGTARFLLEQGVPVAQPGAGRSPLAEAAYWGDNALLEDLIARGAPVNQTRSDGWTPLLAAAWSGQVTCVTNLLARGADLDVPFRLWEGHRLPTWKVIEERAALGPEAAAVWNAVVPWVDTRRDPQATNGAPR